MKTKKVKTDDRGFHEFFIKVSAKGINRSDAFQYESLEEARKTFKEINDEMMKRGDYEILTNSKARQTGASPWCISVAVYDRFSFLEGEHNPIIKRVDYAIIRRIEH